MDLHKEPESATRKRPNALKLLISDHNLYCHKFETSHTYMHPNGFWKSHIDYVFTSQQNKMTKYTIIPCSLLNVSTHTSVAIELGPEIVPQIKSKGNVIHGVKVNWKVGDLDAYQDKLQQKLSMFNTEYIDVEANLSLLHSALKETAEETFKTSKRTQNTAHKRKPWNPELSSAVNESNKAHYLWKCQGQPEPNHPAAVARKRAKLRIRSVQ